MAREQKPAAEYPDFAEPRMIGIVNPRVVRGFGKLWIVLGTDHTSGPMTTLYYDNGKPYKQRQPATIPLEWFKSEKAAKAWVEKTFGPDSTGPRYSYLKPRSAKLPIYVANDRKKPIRTTAAA